MVFEYLLRDIYSCLLRRVNNRMNTQERTERAWGSYTVLHTVPGMKVKELTVDPGKSLSMQRHFQRSEYWIVSEGSGTIHTLHDGDIVARTIQLHDEVRIPVGDWHQLVNHTGLPLRIVEVQYGENCVEEDIERRPGV